MEYQCSVLPSNRFTRGLSPAASSARPLAPAGQPLAANVEATLTPLAQQLNLDTQDPAIDLDVVLASTRAQVLAAIRAHDTAMATLTATRCNPAIRRQYDRLRSAGKSFRCAMVACARRSASTSARRTSRSDDVPARRRRSSSRRNASAWTTAAFAMFSISCASSALKYAVRVCSSMSATCSASWSSAAAWNSLAMRSAAPTRPPDQSVCEPPIEAMYVFGRPNGRLPNSAPSEPRAALGTLSSR